MSPSPSGRRSRGDSSPNPSGRRLLPRRGVRTPREELADSTAHGHVYLHGLQRAHLTLSLLALVAFGAIFGVLPIALYLLPAFDRVRLLGVPLGLWIVVVPMLPVFVAIGWVYARRADAVDDAFRELVER
ncbi:MAG: sodium/substrate symporter small subunit [Solirubrobacteraceae bacterium]